MLLGESSLYPGHSPCFDSLNNLNDGKHHSVNNRTVVQLPLAASHPPLGCRAFISCIY